jgi:hypothetical protein
MFLKSTFHFGMPYRWKHVTLIHFGQKNLFFFWYILYFWGIFFFISSNVLKTHKIKFWCKTFNTILVIFQMIMFFQQTCMYSHNYTCFTQLHLFQWKISFRCLLWNCMNETFHIELKWNNEYMIKYFIKFDNHFNDF